MSTSSSIIALATIFAGESIPAILSGTKTQTRRHQRRPR